MPTRSDERKRTISRNRRRVRGGILATIGYLLSPLSWWNDLLVNIPLAYVFATIVGLVSRQLFVPALILGYWLTNILGFVLLHIGAEDIVTGEENPYTKRDLAKDLLLSVGYTIVVVVLVHIGWLTFPEGLFS
jgi:hypothetical protein